VGLFKKIIAPAGACRAQRGVYRSKVKTHAPSADLGERKIYETIVGRAIMIIAVYHTNTHAAFAVSAPRTRESCVLRGWKLSLA
jgi:hypothetical protein